MVISKEWDNLLELISDGIIITDHQGVIVKVNKAYERMLSIKAVDLVGRNMSDLKREGFLEESSSLKVIETKHPVTLIQEHFGKDLIVTGMPMFNEQNELILVINCVRDITELNQLKRSMQQIEQINHSYFEQLTYLRQREIHLDGLVAHSQSMREVLTNALKVAAVDSPVMLRGESGVGKEVIAKFIHQNSRRNGEAFIKVNCGAIPEKLMESEFFGYESGAFTGAGKGGKPGVFELANKGTLFLDEVGDMSLDLQVKLLRVLEEKEFRRIGGVKTIQTDVRIIAATHQHLEEMVAQKQFRQDLYYRLQVYPISIPPLRERKEDIPFLVDSFARKYEEKHPVPLHIDPVVKQLLCRCDWPGNIRELFNMLERLAITSNNGEILPDHLPLEMYRPVGSTLPRNFLEEVEMFEYQGLKQALVIHKTTRKAAQSLGMSQTTYVRKLNLYRDKFETDPKMEQEIL
ncbi:UNVERIFIED_CONTAM: PAS domain S-box-containing protein [Brevibacillus sp. OAP136]